MADRMLQHVRVVDLSQYIPGPLATRQLADLGADVIKIEPPGGDPMRHFMGADPNEISPIYRHLNRGKRICKLDLKSEAGKNALSALLADADILLESFRPGVLARLGFDHERLEIVNPQLIHCALSGFGQTGPYAERAGHDINYCALAAQSIVSGAADRPVIGYPPIADHASAQQAAIAMLAALHARQQGRGGVFLDISITESILAWQYLPALGHTNERAASILNGGAACYNIYRCADDRFVSLGAIESHFWENFCTVLQQPGWIGRQYETMPQASLIAEVAKEIGAQTSEHWHRLLDDVDCCYAPLLEPAQLPENRHFRARHAWTGNGPSYSGWINGKTVDIGENISEIESGNPPTWLAKRNH